MTFFTDIIHKNNASLIFLKIIFFSVPSELSVESSKISPVSLCDGRSAQMSDIFGRSDIGTVVTLPLIIERAKSMMEFCKKNEKKQIIWEKLNQIQFKLCEM